MIYKLGIQEEQYSFVLARTLEKFFLLSQAYSSERTQKVGLHFVDVEKPFHDVPEVSRRRSGMGPEPI